MASQEELQKLVLEDIKDLPVSEDISDLIERAIVLYNPSTGAAMGFKASLLTAAALAQRVAALESKVQALENKSFIHLTLVEWQELEESGNIIPGKWYLVYSDETLLTLKRIYIGSELIAQRAEGGSVGFPYTFPFDF